VFALLFVSVSCSVRCRSRGEFAQFLVGNLGYLLRFDYGSLGETVQFALGEVGKSSALVGPLCRAPRPQPNHHLGRRGADGGPPVGPTGGCGAVPRCRGHGNTVTHCWSARELARTASAPR
jgi:hypothetical protein